MVAPSTPVPRGAGWGWARREGERSGGVRVGVGWGECGGGVERELRREGGLGVECAGGGDERPLERELAGLQFELEGTGAGMEEGTVRVGAEELGVEATLPADLGVFRAGSKGWAARLKHASM